MRAIDTVEDKSKARKYPDSKKKEDGRDRRTVPGPTVEGPASAPEL
jgi:hypothetical protein